MSRSIEFWSSVELGTFARGLLRELAELGWSARQRFEVTEDQYRDASSRSERFRLRWRSYVSYARSLRRRLRKEKAPTAIIVCTNTFYAPAVAIHAARKLGVPVVHWVFDLFPDVLVAGGKTRPRGFGDRCLGRLTRATFEGAAVNVFLGDRLLQHAKNRYGEIPRSVVIPVGADAKPFENATPQERSPQEPLRILYCGNLGRMHETRTVVEFLRLSPPSGWTLEFRGHGSGFRSLAASVAATSDGAGIVLGDSLAEAEWTSAMKEADVALVTMKCGTEGLVMPSKTYSAMVAGQAILAICPGESDLAETVRRHDAGWVIEPGDVTGLGAVLSGAVARPRAVLEKRLNAFRAGHDHYDQRTLAVAWDNLLTSIGGDKDQIE